MKHILIIPSWYPSRHRNLSGIFFKEQAEVLSKKEIKIGVVSPLFRSFKDIDLSFNKNSKSIINGVITYSKEIWHYPKFNNLNKYIWFKTCKKLFEKYIKDNGRPDLIHIHSLKFAGQFAFYIYNKYKIPFIVTEHSEGYTKKEYKDFKKYLKYSSYNIAVSVSLAKAMNEKVGYFWEVIPNTIPNIFFEEGKKNLQNNRINKKYVFFTLSNLNLLKGVNYLVEAFYLLSKEIENIELLIGGDGNERKNIKRLINKYQLEDKIKLLGELNRKEVIENFKKADFYVSPSLQETFGIVIIEALAMGLPTIATKCGGPEFILNHNTGIIVEKASKIELFKAMNDIIINKNKYSSKDIINYCEENYSEDIVTKMIFNIYNKILNG